MEENYEFTEQDKDAIESFLSLAFYNGWEQDIEDICEALRVSKTIKPSLISYLSHNL